MRTIKIIEHISLDGVVQAPGGPDEDGDYEHGGWIVPFADPAVGQAIMAAHAGPFDLLLGRRTYDIWAAYWPGARGSPLADRFNAARKYVATHRPESLGWGPAEALRDGLVDHLRLIRASEGPELILWGSSTITPVLLEHGLVDEVMLLIYPIFLGAGKRFIRAGAEARELTLVSTRAAPSGVLINMYRPAGRVRTGSFPKPPV